MTNNDDLLKELKTALEAEPSREFAAGVRARVSHSQAQTRRMWWGLAAAASVTLATVALWRPAADEPVTTPVAPMQASVPAVRPAPPETVIARETPVPAVVRRVTPVVRVVADAATEPQLEVITNQPAVLRQLWARYQGRPLVAGDAEPAVDGLAAKPVTVNPIVVPSIVVGELGTESGRGGATPIIRRATATKETR